MVIESAVIARKGIFFEAVHASIVRLICAPSETYSCNRWQTSLKKLAIEMLMDIAVKHGVADDRNKTIVMPDKFSEGVPVYCPKGSICFHNHYSQNRAVFLFIK